MRHDGGHGGGAAPEPEGVADGGWGLGYSFGLCWGNIAKLSGRCLLEGRRRGRGRHGSIGCDSCCIGTSRREGGRTA